jgi:hypothetical protein
MAGSMGFLTGMRAWGVYSCEKIPGFAGGLAKFDSSIVILFVLVLVLELNHSIQAK